MDINQELELNLEQLMYLGFTVQEVQIFNKFLNSGTSLTINTLAKYNIYGPTQARVLYLKKLYISGLLEPDNLRKFTFLEKHFRKMSGEMTSGNLSLPVARPMATYQRAVVTGITDPYFSVLNSSKSELKLHKVETASSSKIVIQVSRKVELRVPKGYFAGKNKLTKIPNVLEVLEYYSPDQSKEFFARIAINVKYARLINQYVIVAGAKEVQGHLGAVKSVTSQGSILYVYAKPIYTTKKINNAASERVYVLDYDLGRIGEHITKVLEWLKGIINNKWKVKVKYQELLPTELEGYKVITLTEQEKNKLIQAQIEEW
jgi:hypothetical protein